MTDNVAISHPSESPSTSTSQERKGIRGWSWIKGPPKEPASVSMLHLARTNLGVRLRTIDEASLKSECQKKIYSAVTEMLKAPADASAMTEGRGWDKVYEAESSIALLYSGEQLRQQIGACLQDLTDLDQAEADALRPVCQQLRNKPVDESNPGPGDAMLRMCLLRLMESVHWNDKKKYLVRELHRQATHRILIGLLVSFVVLILPYVFIYLDFSPQKQVVSGAWWTLLVLWTALTAGLFGAFFFRLTDINSQSTAMSVDKAVLQPNGHTRYYVRALVSAAGSSSISFFGRELPQGHSFRNLRR